MADFEGGCWCISMGGGKNIESGCFRSLSFFHGYVSYQDYILVLDHGVYVHHIVIIFNQSNITNYGNNNIDGGWGGGFI